MIRIIADTTCSLPRQQLQDLGIAFLPQIIIFGNESFRDDNEIDTSTFLRKLRAASELPKTAAPPPSMYGPIYKEYVDEEDTIFVIAPSADLSGTFRSATVAAQDFPGADIRVFDSRTVAGGLGQMVLQVWEWVQQGMEPDQIEDNLKRLSARNKTFFVVDTLEYLYRGGRIGGAQALFGSILQVKPILYLKDGRTEPLETQRTKRRAVVRMQQLVISDCPCTPEARLAISQCDAYDEAQEMADFFTETMGLKNIPIYEAPPAIVVHAGPKILSTSFYTAN